jgi:predicted O-methyltransferase YrrM
MQLGCVDLERSPLRAACRRGHVYSLEHDPFYAQRTRVALERRQLGQWATVIDAPLRPLAHPDGEPWYSLENLPSHAGPFDMLIIDGPPAATAPLARQPALPVLWTRLGSNCVIFLDDADRNDEKAAVATWMQEHPELRATVLPAEKGCVRLSAVAPGSV